MSPYCSFVPCPEQGGKVATSSSSSVSSTANTLDKSAERAANIAAQLALEDDTVKVTSSPDALVGGAWGDVVITFSTTGTGLQATAFDGDVADIDLSPVAAAPAVVAEETTPTVQQEAAAATSAAAAAVAAQMDADAATDAAAEVVTGTGPVSVTVTAIATPTEINGVNTLFVASDSVTVDENSIPAPPSQDSIIAAAIDAAYNTVEPTKEPSASPSARPTMQAKDNTIAQGKALCQLAMYVPALTKLSFGTNWQGGAKCPANTYTSGVPEWCAWQGVSCAKGDPDKLIPYDVTTLKISGDYYRQSEGISGLLPSGFSLLTGLESLTIEKTYLSGTVPSALGTFDRLKEIVLSNNDFAGSIPTSISELSLLTTLQLDHNHFSGEIPYSFAKLHKLSDLNLGYNSMSSSIPTMMGAMFSLKSLNLAHMSLRGTIPNSMGLLSALTTMQLQYNSLSGAVPTSFSKLTAVAPDLSANPYLGMSVTETKYMMSANPFVIVPAFTETVVAAADATAADVSTHDTATAAKAAVEGTDAAGKKRGVGGKVHDERRNRRYLR